MKIKFLLFTITIFTSSLAQEAISVKYSAKELAEDLDILEKTIINVHPNPYHTISKQRFEEIRDSLKSSFTDGMAIEDAWKAYSFLIASMNEGHGSVGYPVELQKKIKEDKENIFPILIKEFNGQGWVVRYDLSTDSILKAGDLITAINGRSAAELMTTFTTFYGGLPAWKNIQATRDFAGTLILHGVRAPYRITYTSNGENKTTEISGVVVSEMQARAAEVRKKNTLQATPAPYSFNRTAENIGYMNFRQMRDLTVFQHFLDSVFSDIKINPITGLIIDLRQNGGGSSQLGVSLLNYINDKPYRMGSGVIWKVSDEYKSFIQDQAKINSVYTSIGFKNYLSHRSGQLIKETESQKTHPGKNQLRYHGKICVLIGPNTFSSANMLANAIKDFQLATLIGEPTGEAPNDYGELYWNKLPDTKLTFYTCTKQFIRANGDAGDPNPIFPDIEIKQNPQSPKDDVLEFAIEWVKKN